MSVALFTLGGPTAAVPGLAELGVPVEWFALSAGAKIAMDSGTENLDWVARVLRRLVEFTQRGGEVNVLDDFGRLQVRTILADGEVHLVEPQLADGAQSVG